MISGGPLLLTSAEEQRRWVDAGQVDYNQSLACRDWIAALLADAMAELNSQTQIFQGNLLEV